MSEQSSQVVGEPVIEDAPMETQENDATADTTERPDQPLFDASKLLEGVDGARKVGRDVVICRDLSTVQQMYAKQNIMKGIKVGDQEKQKEETKEVEPSILRIPEDMMKEFEELDHRNEEMFEFVAFSIVIEFLEKRCLRIQENEAAEP